MILIPVMLENDCFCSSVPLPNTAIKIVCDGVNYIVYEQGDALPPEPVYEEPISE